MFVFFVFGARSGHSIWKKVFFLLYILSLFCCLCGNCKQFIIYRAHSNDSDNANGQRLDQNIWRLTASYTNTVRITLDVFALQSNSYPRIMHILKLLLENQHCVTAAAKHTAAAYIYNLCKNWRILCAAPRTSIRFGRPIIRAIVCICILNDNFNYTKPLHWSLSRSKSSSSFSSKQHARQPHTNA